MTRQDLSASIGRFRAEPRPSCKIVLFGIIGTIAIIATVSFAAGVLRGANRGLISCQGAFRTC